MKKGPKLLQRFAHQHGLQVERYAIRGPRGKIFQAFGRLYYSQPGTGYHKFNPIIQAEQAIETIGLQSTAPVEPVKEDRRALLIATKEVIAMTMTEFAQKYGFKSSKYFHSCCIHKSRRQAKGRGRWGYICENENGQVTCSVTRSGIGGFQFDPNNPIEAAAAFDAIGLDHWCIWRRYGQEVDSQDQEAVSASRHEWLLAVRACQRSKFRQTPITGLLNCLDDVSHQGHRLTQDERNKLKMFEWHLEFELSERMSAVLHVGQEYRNVISFASRSPMRKDAA
ncbi:MAG: hypothetical protein LAN18_03910 [Acidobacteriia bacterium]|nr:hypothetical protein [Terriglobia bacterium]